MTGPADLVSQVTAESFTHRRDRHVLWDAVALMPEPRRTVLRLFYVEKRSPGEIASSVALPPDSVRRHLEGGLLALRRELHVRDRRAERPAP